MGVGWGGGCRLSLGFKCTRHMCVFELQLRVIYHRASFRVCPLAGEIIQDLYAGLRTDMGGLRVCTLGGETTTKTNLRFNLQTPLRYYQSRIWLHAPSFKAIYEIEVSLFNI